MITNCNITAWSKRIGSDQRGEPQYESQTLATPVQACCGELTAGQVRIIEHSRIEADLSVTYEPINGQPAVGNGDKIVIDDRIFLVTKTTDTPAAPVIRRMLYVKETNE